MKKAVVLGTFDGLHLGHQAVIQSAKGYDITVVTFKAPPKSYFEPDIRLVISNEDKKRALIDLGVKNILELDFLKVKDKTPVEFLDFIVDKFNPLLVSCGENYHFGKNALGTTELLGEYLKQRGIELKVSPLLMLGGSTVSSSEIRKCIKNGEIERANTLLGKPFGFKAKVISGDKRGRTLGFPTINQAFPDNLTVPLFGVYKTEVLIDGKHYQSITNIGKRPTYEVSGLSCETFIKDFSGELYDKAIRLNFLKFIREETKFNSKQELKEQIIKDVKEAFI